MPPEARGRLGEVAVLGDPDPDVPEAHLMPPVLPGTETGEEIGVPLPEHPLEHLVDEADVVVVEEQFVEEVDEMAVVEAIEGLEVLEGLPIIAGDVVGTE
jgi:hypothetical protein